MRGSGNRGAALPALFTALLLAAALSIPSAAASPRFSPMQIPVKQRKLFDLSVADIDGDGDLDVFSTNHKYRGAMALNDGAGGFTESLDSTGLSSTAGIPGFDDLFSEPDLTTKGLYVWVDAGGNTHIHTHGLGSIVQIPFQRVTGEIRYYGREAAVRHATGARVDVTQDPDQPSTSVVSFDAGPEADVKIRANFMDLPFKVSVDPLFPRSRVLLGPRLSHPPASDFTIDLGDRHGVAWADFDGSGSLDAYIANGGLRGAIKRFGDLAADELYFGNGSGHFTEGIARTGISKGFCRGRYAAPVDYDGDGDLDVFVGCEGLHPILWRQRPNGTFGSHSEELAQARVRGQLFRWINLDGEGTPELVAVLGGKIAVYGRNATNDGYVRRQLIHAPRQGNIVDTITLGDEDADGDPDLFIGSRAGNSLLLNKGGELKLVDPGRLGLPRGGTVAASFVDFDNNGRLDLNAVPQGLYRRQPTGDYHLTDLLHLGGRARWATASWADFDADGDRDLVSAVKRQGQAVRAQSFRNLGPAGHWLEVDLLGPAANAQAIGASVEVSTAGRTLTGFVGESEGSRYASGQYRLYFGLGRDSVVHGLQVRWPDGTTTDLGTFNADRLLRIAYPGG